MTKSTGVGRGGHNKLAERRLKVTGTCYEFTIWEDSCPRDWLTILSEWNVPLAVSPVHTHDFYTRRNFAERPHLLKDAAESIRSGELQPMKSDVVIGDMGETVITGEVIEDSSELESYCNWLDDLYNHFNEDGFKFFPEDNKLPLLMKKPHRHICVDYKRCVSLNVFINNNFDIISSLGIDPMRDVRTVAHQGAFTRYLCHLNEDDKVTYPVREIICLKGYDLLKYIDVGGEELVSFREQALNMGKSLKTRSWAKIYDAAISDEDSRNLAAWIWNHQAELDRYFRSVYFDDEKNRLAKVCMSDNMSYGNLYIQPFSLAISILAPLYMVESILLDTCFPLRRFVQK